MASLYLGNSSSVLLKTSAKSLSYIRNEEWNKEGKWNTNNERQVWKEYSMEIQKKKRSGKSNTANYRDEAQAGKDWTTIQKMTLETLE